MSVVRFTVCAVNATANQLLSQRLLRKLLEYKRKPLLWRQYGHPHNAIAQGRVIAVVPLIEIVSSGLIFDPDAVQLNWESVEYKYGIITMVEAVW